MKIYKYKDLLVILTAVGWISFIYSAFMGFHFWYLGFVFFFWLCLSILNYRHETTLWLMKNNTHLFIRYYFTLALLGFVADYIIGQLLAGFWIYPFYNTLSAWLRLYFLIYPLGGMSVVELIYLVSAMFREKIVLIHENVKDSMLTKVTKVNNFFLISIIIICLISRTVIPLQYSQGLIVLLFSISAILTTIKLKYYLKHPTHWIGIIVTTVLLAMFVHEIPNTAVYEWRYFPLPVLNYSLLNIPLWVYWGWYFLVLAMLKYWISMVLMKDRK